MLSPFLTTNWRYLAMLNYRVDPALLTDYIPPGVELDFCQGEDPILAEAMAARVR